MGSNEAGLVQGHLDIPLNDRGRAQIGEVAKRRRKVDLSRIYTSDLARAVESAEIVAEQQETKEIVVEEGLRDRYYGSLQGCQWTGESGIPADAESQECLTARIQSWLSNLLAEHTPTSSPESTPPSTPTYTSEETILVVTHEECIMTMLNILLVSLDVRMTIAENVDLGLRVGNGSLGILQIWWNRDGQVNGRIDRWAMGAGDEGGH